MHFLCRVPAFGAKAIATRKPSHPIAFITVCVKFDSSMRTLRKNRESLSLVRIVAPNVRLPNVTQHSRPGAHSRHCCCRFLIYGPLGAQQRGAVLSPRHVPPLRPLARRRYCRNRLSIATIFSLRNSHSLTFSHFLSLSLASLTFPHFWRRIQVHTMITSTLAHVQCSRTVLAVAGVQLDRKACVQITLRHTKSAPGKQHVSLLRNEHCVTFYCAMCARTFALRPAGVDCAWFLN